MYAEVAPAALVVRLVRPSRSTRPTGTVASRVTYVDAAA
jgi:hypothetical protein